MFEEFQTMKGTRNVTAAQTASGEAAQGARSFFFSFLVYACLYIFPGACAADVKSHFPCLDKAVSQHFSTQNDV